MQSLLRSLWRELLFVLHVCSQQVPFVLPEEGKVPMLNVLGSIAGEMSKLRPQEKVRTPLLSVVWC